MTDVLGYERYLAQGGDWGGAISSWLGYDHAPSCTAIHINIMTMRHPDGPRGLEEKAWAEAFKREQIMENGYRTQQATKPQTLSYAMIDSPVGVAAWIIEKYWAWTDSDGDPENVLSKDEMLDNIMVYWLNAAGSSSARIYWERWRPTSTNTASRRCCCQQLSCAARCSRRCRPAACRFLRGARRAT